MTDVVRPEQLGWREKLCGQVIRAVGEDKFLSPYGATPDNITLLKPLATVAALLSALAGLGVETVIIWVALSVISDTFDGPVARALTNLGRTPPPIFLSKWLPFLKGGTFDAVTDKIAMFTGLSIVIALGYPAKPVLLLYFWIVVKILAAAHGAWLTGLDYRDLGRLIIGRPPTDGFQNRLMSYLDVMTEPVYVGRIELHVQLAGLVTGILWLLWPHGWLVKLGWLIGFVAIYVGYASYSTHMRRYLEQNEATFHPQGRVWLPLADSERNRRWLPWLVTNLLVGLALYRLKKPS